MLKSTLLIQCHVRSKIARNKLKKLRQEARDIEGIKAERDELKIEVEMLKSELKKMKEQMSLNNNLQAKEQLASNDQMQLELDKEENEQPPSNDQIQHNQYNEAQLDEMESIKKQALEMKDTLEDVEKKKKEKIDMLNGSLMKKDEEKIELEMQLDKYKQEVETLSHSLEQERTKTKELSAKLDSTKKKVSIYKYVEAPKTHDCDDVRGTLEMYANQMGVYQNKIANLKKDLVKSAVTIDNLRKDLRKANEQAKLYEDKYKHPVKHAFDFLY